MQENNRTFLRLFSILVSFPDNFLSLQYQSLSSVNHIFNDIEIMKNSGFTGFLTIGVLRESRKELLPSKGVYFVLYTSESTPTFVERGSGGFFKGKNPNVSMNILKEKWVEETKLVYIGRGGQKGKNSTLHSRLSDYLRFGQGKNVGHWGGRYIYQIENPENLVICWKYINEPEEVESELLDKFINTYGKLPFGNLRR